MSDFLHRWRLRSTETAALLLLFQLPIASLYKLSSWLLIMRAGEITEEVALLVVIYALAAAVTGLAIGLPESLLARHRERLAQHWHAIALAAVIFVISITMLTVVMAWWRDFTSHIPGLRRVPFQWSFGGLTLIVLAAIAVRARRSGWLHGVDRLSAQLCGASRTLQVVVALSALVVAVTGYARIKPFGWSDEKPVAQAPPGAPNIVLISVDTLAAKDMSLYGYRLPTTPHLDEFARSAYVFDHYYANSNYTIPTVTSMLTGRYPTSHRVTQLRGRLTSEDGRHTLAHVLQQSGYVTASVVANDGAHPMYLGFSDGFDYQAPPLNGAPGHNVGPALTLIRSRAFAWLWDWWCSPYTYVVYPLLNFDSLQRQNWYPAARVIDKAIEVAQSDKKPLFLWTHFMSPHEPYLPPPPFLGKFLPAGELDGYRSQMLAARGAMGFYPPSEQPTVDKLRLRYDEFVNYTDDAVHELLQRLERAGTLENAIVIITADHGQSFERGWHGHVGPYLHDALIRIPLIVKLPGQKHTVRIEANAEEVDLLPTILDLAGIAAPQWAEGVSQKALLDHDVESGLPKYSFDLQHEGRFDPPRAGNFAVIQGREKFIHRQASGCEEYYDLTADPDQLHNRVAEMPVARRVAMRDLLSRKAGVALKPNESSKDCRPANQEVANAASAEH